MRQPARQSRLHLPARADIQSLRALAVAMVVAAHAHVPGLQGGYVGVDVFYVLSGYLISGLILREIDSTGSFSLWAFYARRLKRLLPALLLVLLVVAAAARLVGTPSEPADASAGQAAILWLSNFYFSARSIDYFSAGRASNLLLHTWSLAVEEQFYLIWPWLLLFSYGVWTWQGAPRNRKRLFMGMAMTAVASLSIGTYWAQTDFEAGFYLMPGRMWEFALGALVFLLRDATETQDLRWLDQWRSRSLFNILGWLIILTTSLYYSDHLRYPGLWALLPCIGAALVLFDTPERRPSAPASRLLLRQPAIQFIGNISYSLYLWHWPVLILGSDILGDSALVRLALVSFSILLAAITYYTVENPVRRLQIKNPIAVLVPSALGMALTFVGLGAWHSAAENMLMHAPAQARIERARLDVPSIYSKPVCDSWYSNSQVVPCSYGPAGARHTVVLLGDSVLAQWLPAANEIYRKKPNWKVIVLTKSACPASQVSYYYDTIKAEYTTCDIWRQRALDYLVRLRPDIIIMGSAHYPFTDEQWLKGTRVVLDRLSPVVKHIIVMGPTPALGFDGPDCLLVQTRRPRWLPQARSCATSLTPAADDSVYALLTRASMGYDNVHLVDLRNVVCPRKICQAQIGHTIAYRDSLHLTRSFVRSLAPAMASALYDVGI